MILSPTFMFQDIISTKLSEELKKRIRDGNVFHKRTVEIRIPKTDIPNFVFVENGNDLPEFPPKPRKKFRSIDDEWEVA